jgi:hypothetical protein
MPKDDQMEPLEKAEAAARRFIEDSGADAVVILWTSRSKRATRFFRHQIGNAILCNALVERTAEQQCEVEEDE